MRFKVYLLFLIILFVFILSPLWVFASQWSDSEIPPKPLNLGSFEFPYPTNMMKLGIEGKVVLELWVDSIGNVYNVILTKSVHLEYDLSAVREAKKIKFKPARVKNKDVAVNLLFPVRFSLGEKNPSRNKDLENRFEYFNMMNNNGRISDTMYFPDIVTLNLLKNGKAVDIIDNSISIVEGVTYPSILNSEDFNMAEKKDELSGFTEYIVYMKVLLNGEGIPQKIALINPAIPELDSLALNIVDSLKFSPATYLDKPIPASFFIKAVILDYSKREKVH